MATNYSDAAEELRRQALRSRRDLLRRKVADLIRSINKPLHEIIADHALPYLPSQSLHRFKLVSKSWRQRIASPIFVHTQTLSPSSASGVFTNSPTKFVPFDPKSHSIPSPSLSFLPCHHIAVKSSSNGLICCVAGSSSFSSYVICNPSTMQWTTLPRSPIHHGADPNLVLVFNPSVYNFRCDYHLVCPLEISRGLGVYGFDVYDSAAGTWRVSSEIATAEEIVERSGVAAGGKACWRTTMQTVVVYDPAGDVAREVAWPYGYEKEVAWELASIEGRACCVGVTRGRMSVHVLGEGEAWGLLWEGENVPGGGSSSRGWVRPLRFESGNREAMVAVGDDDVAVLDMVGRRVRYWVGGIGMSDLKEGLVAYVSTLAAVCPPGS